MLAIKAIFVPILVFLGGAGLITLPVRILYRDVMALPDDGLGKSFLKSLGWIALAFLLSLIP